MKLCKHCKKKFWPFMVALVVTSFAVALTWMTLSASGLSNSQAGIWASLVFVVVGGSLVGYMVNCLRRYCRQDRHAIHSH